MTLWRKRFVDLLYGHRVRYCSPEEINSGSEPDHITLILSELAARWRAELYKTLHERGKGPKISCYITNSRVFFQPRHSSQDRRILPSGVVDRTEGGMTEVDEKGEDRRFLKYKKEWMKVCFLGSFFPLNKLTLFESRQYNFVNRFLNQK